MGPSGHWIVAAGLAAGVTVLTYAVLVDPAKCQCQECRCQCSIMPMPNRALSLPHPIPRIKQASIHTSVLFTTYTYSACYYRCKALAVPGIISIPIPRSQDALS
ncbi:hypothetical protein F5Y12DRAFT_185067 [Xylaria sp. FL1777]|nr:hypothetical protein F5Y12DRAFT_185067 [Xylaria sp. FL1777]